MAWLKALDLEPADDPSGVAPLSKELQAKVTREHARVMEAVEIRLQAEAHLRRVRARLASDRFLRGQGSSLEEFETAHGLGRGDVL